MWTRTFSCITENKNVLVHKEKRRNNCLENNYYTKHDFRSRPRTRREYNRNVDKSKGSMALDATS